MENPLYLMVLPFPCSLFDFWGPSEESSPSAYNSMVQISRLYSEHCERDREARCLSMVGGKRNGRHCAERRSKKKSWEGLLHCHPLYILLFAAPGIICQKVSVHFYTINNSPAKLLLIGLGFLS